MKRSSLRRQWIFGGIAALSLGLGLGVWQASAKTPDGQPPAQETVCSSLEGAAFGVCNAYCEAQDCDVHERPSCQRLRTNYEKLTGTPILPCDARCGDGAVNQPFEECDDGNNDACDGCAPNCRAEFCGDGVVCAEQGEQCESDGQCGPAGAGFCRDDCLCVETEIPCSASNAPACDGTCPIDFECRSDPGIEVCVCQQIIF